MTGRANIVVDQENIAVAEVDHIIVNAAAAENDRRTADGVGADHTTEKSMNEKEVETGNITLETEKGKEHGNVSVSERRNLCLPFYYLEPEINSLSKKDHRLLECKLHV